MHRFSRRSLVLLAVCLWSLADVQAQVTNFWTNAANGVWSNAANWSNGAPVSATNTVVQFNASGGDAYRATNTVANFLLNRMVLNSSSTNPISIVGSNLIFRRNGATLPQILQNNSGAVVISNAIAADTNLTFAGTGTGGVVVAGVISSNINLIKSGNYVLTLTGANTFGGTGRSVTINGGVLAINSDARLGNTANTISIASNATLRTYGTFNSARSFTAGTGGARIEVTNATTLTLTGAKNFATGLTKEGAGTLIVSTTAGAGNGRVTNNAGTLRIDVATGLGVNTSNTIVRIAGGTVLFNNNALVDPLQTYQLAGGTYQATRGAAANDAAATLEVRGPISALTGTTSTISLIDGVFPTNGVVMRMIGNVSGPGAINVVAGSARGVITFTNTANTYTGDISFNSNVTALAIHSNATPLAGAKNITLRNGASLILRYGNTNAGNGNNSNLFYLTNNLHVLNDGQLDVRRPGNIGVGNTNAFASLTVSNGIFTTTGDANYQLKFFSNTTLFGSAVFNVSNLLNVSLDGAILEGAPGASLRKTNIGTLLVTNFFNHTYSGGTIIEQGVLTTVVGSNGVGPNFVTNPLGTGNDVILRGGTLNFRGDTNVTLGPGAGYDVHVYSNATISVDRFSAAGGAGRAFSLDNLYIHSNAVLSANNANTYVLRFAGPAFVETNFSIGGNGLISLEQGIVETNGTGYSFNKVGTGTVLLTNFSSNLWQGTTFVSQGTLRVHIDPNNTAFAAGPKPDIILQGGTIDARATNSMVFGPGANGYNLVVLSNSTINVANSAGALTDRAITVNNVTINNGAQLAESSGNNFIVRIAGTTTLNGQGAFSPGGARGANIGSIEILGPIVDGTTNGTLIKRGAQVLAYASSNNPTFSGGTVVNAGSLTWQTAAGLQPGTYQFGTGPITVDGGSGAQFAFRGAANGNYTLLNNFIINSTVSTGGIFGYGGGTIDTARAANSPTVDLAGAIDLRGVLYLSNATANTGSSTPVSLNGTVTVAGGDRTIQVLSSGNTGVANNRVRINGNIAGDAPGRALTLVANNGSGLELAGTNSGLGSIIVKPSYQGAVGRVRFATSNSLPAGSVTVEPGAFVGIGFNPAIFGTNLASLGTRFNLRPGSVIGLDSVANTYLLNLGPAGLNQDVRVGASAGFTASYILPVTPFADTYRLGGGGGGVTLSGTNQLTGTARLSAFPEPYLVAGNPVAGGSLTLANSNSFSGGTVINPGGTLVINNSNTLGTGAVDIYGTLQASGINGSLLRNGSGGLSNANTINTHAGSLLLISANVTPANFNRFGDATALTLNGSSLRFDGRNAANEISFEVIGDLTVSAGSTVDLRGVSNGTASATIFANTLSRNGSATLQIVQTTAAGTNMLDLGLGNRLIVSNAAPVPVNGMVAPWIVNQTSNSFVTYGASGFTNANFTSADLNTAGPADIVTTSTNPVALTSDRSVHALRSLAPITPAGGTTVTIGSGGVIFAGSQTNRAALNFHDGTNIIEALINVGSGTTTISNLLTASTITKFGDGTLSLGFDQPAYTGGWNLNRGPLTITGGSTNGTALGAAVGGNFVNLNGNVTLNFTSASNNLVYTSGPMVVRDYNNSITANFGGGNNADRVQTIAPLGMTFESPANSPLGALLRFGISQSRSVLRVGGPVTLDSDVAINAQNLTFVTGGSNRVVFADGLVGNNKTLTKFGNGILELAADGSTTFNGGITVNGGVLAVGHSGALGNVFSTATFTPDTVLELTRGLVNFSPVATLNQHAGSAERWQSALNRFSDFTNTVEMHVMPTNVHLQLSTNLVGMTNKTIRLNGGTIEAFYYVDDNRSTPVVLGQGVTLELGADGRIGQSGVDVGRANVVFSNNATVVDFGGARSLTKIGPDVVVLGAQNTYSGGTFVNQGTLRLGTNNALLPTQPLVVDVAGTFDLGGFNQTVSSLTGNGTLTNGGASRVITVNEAGSNTFSGLLVGAIDFVKGGNGSITLNNPLNSAAGSRQVFDGTLFVDGQASATTGPLGTPSSPVSLLGINVDARLLTKGAYTVPNPITSEGNFGYFGSKVIGGATAHESTFSGNIALFDHLTFTAASGGTVNATGTIVESGGFFGINKTGAGTVNITGSNGYSGQTTVSAGRLQVNNTAGSATGTGLIEVQAGATLGGGGRIGGSVSIIDDGGTGGMLTPGNSIGALRIDGNLSFTSLAGVQFEIGGLIATNEYDTISVGGDAFLAGIVSLTLTNSYFPTTNSSYTLLSYGSNAGTTRFDNALNNARINTTDTFGSFRINYTSTNVTASAFQYIDNSGDGVFDAWSFKYFGLMNLASGFGPTDKFGDFDGDGMNNFQEFISGTIPTDEGSRHETTAAAVSGTADFAVQWRLADETTFRSPVYRIQFSADLVTWTTVNSPSPITFPQAGIAQWIDNGSQTGGTPPLNLGTPRYYRVLVQ